MIEKLNLEEIDNPGEATLKAFSILNQLVDAVNYHQKWLSEIQRDKDIQNTSVENVQDEFAEQRKWIGKLCRCWDSDINDDTWGILQDIKDNKTEKYYLYGIGYEHCEPVKPDDDIIYKGGDNE